MARILIIGQAPGPNTDPAEPLWPEPASGAGGRLAAFAGLTPAEFLARFDRINLLNEFPGRKWKRDDTWPVEPGRVAASAIRPLLKGRRVILLGRNVAEAFGLHVPFHTWVGAQGFNAAVVPHPSGRNHFYRDSGNSSVSAAFWRQLTG